MKSTLTTLLSLVAAAVHVAVGATESGGTASVNALFRVLKPDGTTVVGQAVVTAGGGALATINVSAADALAAANGRCAFNVKYDEVSAAALKGTVNRLYSNDTLIAQNSGIDLQPGVLRSIMTQPYLFAGVNNVKVVVNAEGPKPGIGWLRINVAGDCKAAAAPAPTPPKSEPPKTEVKPPAPVPAPAPAPTPPRTEPPKVDAKPPTPAPAPPKTEPPKTEPPKTEPPKTDARPPAPSPAPAPAPLVPPITPASASWNALYSAWGYSNYATTQLKGRNFAKYADLVAINAALTEAVNARKIDAKAFDPLMGRWNALAADTAFKALMANVRPGGDRA